MLILVIVPADGVKGKTWGPSTAGGSTKVRPNIVDESGQNRFSKSASSLEKSRALAIAPSVTSVPELGKYCEFIFLKKVLTGKIGNKMFRVSKCKTIFVL